MKVDCYCDNRGLLSVINSYLMPFTIKRVFWVSGMSAETVRGYHALKNGTQMLICISGKIIVRCLFKDSNDIIEYELLPGEHVIVPPMTWCTQRYVMENSIMLALCDNDYDENDYIRDFNKYKEIIHGY